MKYPVVDHPGRRRLGQKKGTLQIDVHHPVERFFGGEQEVGTFERRDSGVVDQQIQSAEAIFGLSDQTVAVRSQADVGLDFKSLNGNAVFLRLPLAKLRREFRGVLASAVIDGEIEPLFRQLQGNAPSDAARGAGDNRDPIHGVDCPRILRSRQAGRIRSWAAGFRQANLLP